MKNRVIRAFVVCVCICTLIFLPAMITLSKDLYTDITMSHTGRLPTVDTYKKLEKLVNNNDNNKEQIIDDFFSESISFSGSKNTVTSLYNPFISNIQYSNSAVASEPLQSIDSLFSIGDSSKEATNYSSTNTQVVGVDEADILKNDGKYIYTISNNKLVIVEAFPAEELKKISEITIDKGYRAVELYVSKDKLFLITDTLVDSYNRYSSDMKTKILVFDINDMTKPELLKTYEVTGSYTSSRKIDDKVYVFTNLLVRMNNGRYIVPKAWEDNVKIAKETLLTDVQYVPNDEYTSYTQIILFDLANVKSTPNVTTYLGGSASNTYMSYNNLYLAQNRYSETVVYKFSLESTCPRYEAKGVVPGYIVNQFAMDEFDGNFRIATTKNNVNSLYVLGPSMHKLGSVTNIARGETIKSVRFEGNRAYMVTFRNTDPLFVIDLSKVRAPKVLGELKISGYSTYLQTYDENHVIGFGYDGNEWGTNGKLKIALFDVSDVEYPVAKFVEQIDANDSELLTNHKSLLFSKKRNLIAFSVGAYSWRDNSNKVGKVYTITSDNGFELRGEVVHSDDVDRMLFMDDVLYGVSEKSISAHDINTIEVIKELEI